MGNRCLLVFIWTLSLFSMSCSYPVRYRRGDNAWGNPGEVVDVNYHTVITKTVGIPVPQHYTVFIEKHVPVPVKVPYPVHIDRPYAVHVSKPVPVHINDLYSQWERSAAHQQIFPPYQMHGPALNLQHGTTGFKSQGLPSVTSYSYSNHRFGGQQGHSSW